MERVDSLLAENGLQSLNLNSCSDAFNCYQRRINLKCCDRKYRLVLLEVNEDQMRHNRGLNCLETVSLI